MRFILDFVFVFVFFFSPLTFPFHCSFLQLSLFCVFLRMQSNDKAWESQQCATFVKWLQAKMKKVPGGRSVGSVSLLCCPQC